MTDAQDRDQLVPERLQEETPATRLTYLALEHVGAADTQTLAEHTGLSPSTVRAAIRDLDDREEIDTWHTVGDARSLTHSLDPHPDSRSNRR